jgi:membrane protein DedA with SNARE-associated domain
VVLRSGSLIMEDAEPAQYEGFIGWILNFIDQLGEFGVGAALFLETFIPPLPSEAILPAAGFLAYEGRMNVWYAWLAANTASLLGALVWFGIGASIGRTRVRAMVGKIPLLDVEDFDRAEVFFTRWGGLAVLVGRCVPLVRSFVSIPAGVARMSLLKFCFYTLIGSSIWNGIWIGLGFAFGPAIRVSLERWSELLSQAVLVIMGAMLLWFILARLRKKMRPGLTPQ